MRPYAPMSPLVAGCGSDRANDGGESHGEPDRAAASRSRRRCRSSPDSHYRADVAVPPCPDVRQAGHDCIESNQADGQDVLAADPGGGRQGASTEGQDRGTGRSMSLGRGLCHDDSSWSGMKIASTVSPKLRAMSSASGRDGRYRSFSIELIVCRDTPSALASSPCDMPLAARSSRTRFFM